MTNGTPPDRRCDRRRGGRCCRRRTLVAGGVTDMHTGRVLRALRRIVGDPDHPFHELVVSYAELEIAIEADPAPIRTGTK